MKPHLLVLASLIATAAAGCTPSPTADLEANKDLVRQFAEVTNAADWEALAAMVTEDLTRHSTATAGPPVTSREEFIQLQKSFHSSFPDQRITVQQLVAEGDRVAILGTYSGTNTGPMGDIPATGKSVESPFLGIFRIESGKVAELWVEWDNVAMLSQLGLYPPPPPGDSGG
jgi:steroid delta-isomerase-like uncharacterized protein